MNDARKTKETASPDRRGLAGRLGGAATIQFRRATLDNVANETDQSADELMRLALEGDEAGALVLEGDEAGALLIWEGENGR